MSRSIIRRAAAAIAATLSLAACTQSDVGSVVRPTRSPQLGHRYMPIQAVQLDTIMGALSPLAQHIAVGLQDSTVRMRLRRSLLDPHAGISAVDLQSCDDSTGAVGSLLQTGERRGAGAATSVCAAFKQMHGAILYMDPTELAHWDGTTIPIVTAIAHPGQRLPATIRGYRSPNLTIDMPTDGHMAGPVLVVLPIQHESRMATRTTPPVTHAVSVPNPLVRMP